MAGWTSDELEKIAAADELQLASARRDGTLRKPVTIWVVRRRLACSIAASHCCCRSLRQIYAITGSKSSTQRRRPFL